jgi:hypothetical protein
MTGLLLALFLGHADAAELAGVSVPDTASVGGQTLVLNGLGLREKFYFDIYVGSLYLPGKTTSASSAISQDVPKRIGMTFIYSAVTKAQLAEAYDEGIPYTPNPAAVKDRFETLKGYLTDVVAGDTITFDYAPATGTTVTVKGVNKGTIAGKDFMEALWTIYLGTHPPTAKLKSGMLGTNQ